MLLGAMNFPGRSVAKEMHRIAEDGFDFMDLTLEPPGAWLPDGKEVARLAGDLGLELVGHTAWYLPLASPFAELRTVARDLFLRSLDTFAEAGVGLVNIHPDYRVPMHPQDVIRKTNAEVIAEICQDASQRDVTLMVENLDRTFAAVGEMAAILDAVPEAAFHLDVGHANLRLGPGEGNRTEGFLQAFGDRLVHVHVSDNRGGAEDLHLPLGAGFVDWRRIVRVLKESGYDETVTLEVFSREREHLRTSRRMWLRWWSEG